MNVIYDGETETLTMILTEGAVEESDQDKPAAPPSPRSTPLGAHLGGDLPSPPHPVFPQHLADHLERPVNIVRRPH